MKITFPNTKVAIIILTMPLLNSCMLVETLFESRKKQNCPQYFSYWNPPSEKGKKGKGDSTTVIVQSADPQTGQPSNPDLPMVRVTRDENGLVYKKNQKKPKKNPDPRTGYKPKRKPLDPEKHN